MTVRLKGRRHRGYTVPYTEGGPELGGALILRILHEEPKGGALRAMFCLDDPCPCTRCTPRSRLT